MSACAGDNPHAKPRGLSPRTGGQTLLYLLRIRHSFTSWLRGYKTVFMLNSAEHEILNALKDKNVKKFSIFSGSDKPIMLFFLLINVEMTTNVGILTFISRKIFILS